MTLFEIASTLDTAGKYLEADVVLGSMIRLARDRFNGQQTYYGNTRKPVPFRQMPGARSVPVPPAAPVAPVTPVAYNPVGFDNSDILKLNENVRSQANPVKSPKPTGPVKLYPLGLQDPETAPTVKRQMDFSKPPSQSAQAMSEKAWATYLKRIFNNPSHNPALNEALAKEFASGNFDPETGKLTAEGKASIDQFVKKVRTDNFNAVNPKKVPLDGAGVKSEPSGIMAQLNKALNTKIGQKLLSAIKAAYDKFMIAFNLVKSKIPPAALKIFSKIKFVFIFINFANFFNGLLQGTLDYKQTIEFIAACAAINKEVLALLGMIPYIGLGLVSAVIAVNFGAADIVEFFGDPEAGFSFMGFRITGESMRRKTDKIDFSTVDTSTLDPSVQNALRESVPLIQQGLKIREILTDPTMVQNHPWLTKRDDIRFTQFSGTLGMGGFYKRNKAQSQQESPSQESQTQPRSFNNNTFNNNQQQKANTPKLNNYNDLLYKAYTDVTSSSEVTLNNLKNYRDQIITKIQALSSYYPNINAQQAITALDNRIRKYSTQASPA